VLLLVVVQAAVVRDEHCVGLLLLLLLLEVMVVRVRRLVMLGLMVVVLLMCRLWPGSLPTPSLLREHRRTFEGSAHAYNRTVTRTGTHGELGKPRPEQNRCTNRNVSKMEMKVKMELAMWKMLGVLGFQSKP